MREIKKGSTDVTLYFKMVDSADGTPETGLTITDIDITYVRNRATASKNDLTELGAVDGSHEDNKGKEVDGTNAPGLYRIDVENAAFAAGVDDVTLIATCAGCDPAMIEIDLVDNIAKDSYDIVNNGSYGNAKLVRSTTPANTLDVSNTGEAGLDFNNIKNAGSGHTLTNITVPTVTTTGTASTVTDGAKSAELAKVPKSDSNVVWNATAQTTIQTKAAAALTAYDPPTDTQMLAAHSTTDALIGGLNNISTAQVNAEVDTALNTAIPGAPANNSINQRIAAMDDLTQASGGGDLAAVKAKTTNIPALPATEAKQDDLKTQIGTAGAGLTNVGMFSQANTELAAIPDTTGSLVKMIQFLFEYWRNKKTVTDTTETLLKEDASTTLGTATVSDDGTTFTKGEMS